MQNSDAEFWWAQEQVRTYYGIAEGADGAKEMAAKMPEVLELYQAMVYPERLRD